MYRTGWVCVRVAKWISRPTSNREIAGSTPASDLSGNLGSPNPSYEMRRVFEQLFLAMLKLRGKKLLGLCVRVVKGGRLKFCCASFVSSNLTAIIKPLW